MSQTFIGALIEAWAYSLTGVLAMILIIALVVATFEFLRNVSKKPGKFLQSKRRESK